MKWRVVSIILTVGLGVLLPVPARAGEFHFGDTLVCADCHTMHYSQQHTYNSPDPPTNPFAGGGPFGYLLRNDDSNLCLNCHDGQTFAPDVRGANTGTHVREAGALTTGAAPYEDWKGHTLGQSATPPGGLARIKLECYNCHDPHGNPHYRNVDLITYAKGTNDTSKHVFLRSWTLGQIATNYSVGNVDFNEPNPNQSQMGQFCRSCHTDFHGSAGDSNMGGAGGTAWLRHPTADANIGAQGGGHSSTTLFGTRAYRVKVMSPTGDWGAQGTAWAAPPNDLTPTCISCHKAHGNQNPFGLIFLKGTGPTTEEGDADGNASKDAGTNLRALCGQCHVQAG